MEKIELIEQSKLAFDFLEKLYLEISYLIKEIEGILKGEDLVIGRPSGYGISARSSTGLENEGVKLWLFKKMAVFFVQNEFTLLKEGVTHTKFHENLKVIYLRIILDDKELKEPTIYSGVLYDFTNKNKKWQKIENIMNYLEYNNDKIFSKNTDIDYEDANLKFKGRLFRNNLFDINDADTIMEKIISPVLTRFRDIKL